MRPGSLRLTSKDSTVSFRDRTQYEDEFGAVDIESAVRFLCLLDSEKRMFICPCQSHLMIPSPMNQPLTIAVFDRMSRGIFDAQ